MSTTMQDTTELPAWLNVDAIGTEQEREDVIAEARAVSEALRHLSPGIRELRTRAASVVKRFDAMISDVPDDVYTALREAVGLRELDDLCMLILGGDAEGGSVPTEEYLAKLQAKYGESLSVE